jgi:AraC-like DNA-binding protein
LSTAPYDAVNEYILAEFSALVRALGGEPGALLRQAGIDPASFESGHYRPAYGQMVRLVALAATRLQCPDFGMRLAKAQYDAIRSPLLQLVEASRTLGEALEQVSAHSNAHSPACAIWLRRAPSGETVTLGHDILLDGLPQRAQAMEQILLAAHLVICKIMGGSVRARRICFRHQPISPLRTYRHYFGCEVKFGQQEDAIIFRQRDMACPTARPDEHAFSAALDYIDAQDFGRPPLHARVRGMVMNLLGTERCRNEYVADALHLQTRAMHRQLAAEGTSFQRIKNEVRRDLLTYYLELTRLDLTLVSERLGFAEQSALTYFSRKWLGGAPSLIRSRAMSVQNEQV